MIPEKVGQAPVLSPSGDLTTAYIWNEWDVAAGFPLETQRVLRLPNGQKLERRGWDRYENIQTGEIYTSAERSRDKS